VLQAGVSSDACARKHAAGPPWHDEGLVARHPVATLIGKVPLEPEVARATRRRVYLDDGNEQPAVVDLAPDLLIQCIPAAQLALVERDFNARDRNASQMRRAASASCEA
jgi:hypothetical protein